MKGPKTGRLELCKIWMKEHLRGEEGPFVVMTAKRSFITHLDRMNPLVLFWNFQFFFASVTSIFLGGRVQKQKNRDGTRESLKESSR